MEESLLRCTPNARWLPMHLKCLFQVKYSRTEKAKLDETSFLPSQAFYRQIPLRSKILRVPLFANFSHFFLKWGWVKTFFFAFLLNSFKKVHLLLQKCLQKHSRKLAKSFFLKTLFLKKMPFISCWFSFKIHSFSRLSVSLSLELRGQRQVVSTLPNKR